MSCQHTKTSVMTASCGCRKPFLAQRRRQVNKSRDATPILAAKAPRSADLEQLSPKKVSMVSLGCPKNTVDGKRFIPQRHLLTLEHLCCCIVLALCRGFMCGCNREPHCRLLVPDYRPFCSMYHSWHMQPCSYHNGSVEGASAINKG